MRCKWGDIISLEYGKPVKDKDCGSGSVPVYGTNGKIGSSNLPPLCNFPSVILGRKGAYRGVHYSECPFSVIDTAFFVNPLIDELDTKWIYYKFKTYDINSMDSGSAIPSTDRYEIYAMDVVVPTLFEQKAISAVLSALDTKIELNNRINKNLEVQAQAIFKSWFMDFEPFQDGEFVDSELGPIPKGWKVDSLDSIAKFTNGLAMQKFRPKPGDLGLSVLKIRELRQGSIDETSELCSSVIDKDFIVKDGDVIFSWSGSLMVDIWCGGTCGLNQHLFKVTSSCYDKWFYYMWTCYHLAEFQAIAQDKATTMGHIKRSHLAKAKVVIPSKTEYHKLNSVISPLVDLIIKNRLQNQKLAILRDTLLPKLMSGEIRVPLEV